MVKGTGPDDRITSKDVETFVISGPPPAVAAAAAPAAIPAAAPPAMPAAAFEDIPLSNVRQVSDNWQEVDELMIDG